MKIHWCLALVVCGSPNTRAQSRQTQALPEAEYYVAAYAQQYKLPVGFVRSCCSGVGLASLCDFQQGRSRSHAADASNSRPTRGAGPLRY